MKSIGVVALSVVIGIGLGAALFFRPETMVTPPPSDGTVPLESTGHATNGFARTTGDTAVRLEALEGQLQQEKAAREALSREVNVLKQALSSLQAPTQQPSVSISSTELSPTEGEGIPARGTPASQGEEAVRTMVALGVPQETAEHLRRRSDQLNLARLQIQDRASREGWANTSRLRDENKELDRQEDQLRRETGEEAYDRFLFASGQDNRVRVEDVMLESPAAAAGFKMGDVIYSYNKKRVFSWPELREAIAEGQLGEQVTVTIQRGDELREAYLPRGPLGVRLDTVRLSPEVAGQ